MQPARGLGYNVALLGASSLKGKEIKAVFEERNFPLGRLALLDAEEFEGRLTEFDEEPAVIRAVSRENFENIALAVFASSPLFTQQHWQMAETSGCQIIDLSYCLETEPQARLRAPAVENLWADSGSPGCERFAGCRLFVSAHSAAIAIASVLGQLSRSFSLRRSAITVYEPVSERGQAGIEELHRQTVNLLSFQQIPRQVYDSQVAFNLLSSYGGRCRPTLREVQERIQSHVRSLLEDRVAPPALRLLQAPIFYGHAFCCFVELQERAAPEQVENALDQEPLTLWRDPEAQPSVVGVAGSGEVVLGPVESDPACESGFWIWGAVDNLRLAAVNAVKIAETLIPTSNGSPNRGEGGAP